MKSNGANHNQIYKQKRVAHRQARPKAAMYSLHPLTLFGLHPVRSPVLVLLYIPDHLGAESLQDPDNQNTVGL